MWDANTGEELACINCSSPRATQPRDEKLIADFYGVHDYLLSCTAWSHQGIRFLSDHRRVLAREDGAVAIVDALTGVVRRRFPLGNGREDCSCVSPNDAYVAGDFEDGTIHVWNAETGQELAVLKHSSEWIRSMLFSPDSTRLFSCAAGEDQIRIWDVATGHQLYTLPGSDLVVEFSPDKNHLLTAGEEDRRDMAYLWSRRRPEYWWGVAWLPEFWLTALFSAAFAWSVWRDRRAA
jgi:WD40 repeat protein